MNLETLEQYSGIAANIEALKEEINALYVPISSRMGEPAKDTDRHQDRQLKEPPCGLSS